MQIQPEAVGELQAEGRHFVGEAELVRGRKHVADMRGGGAGLDAFDRAVEPLARLLVGVVLRRRGAADVEGAVVAGAVAHKGLQNVEERLVAGANHAVGEIVRVRAAALAGNRVDRLDVVGAVRVEEFVDLGDDVVLADAGTQHLVDHVVGAVDHRRGAVEQRDLVGRFDFARAQHDLLAVLDLETGLFQLEHHRRLDDVDADRHLGDARRFQDRGHLLGVALHQAEGGIDGAAQAHQAGLAVLRLEPGRIELVMDRRRAEVPQDRIAAAAHQERPARQLVARPFADLGRGDVTDVVVVEQQQRAEVGGLESGLRAAQPVTVQAAVVDALLEIDAHGAEHRQMTAPVVARVDVLGRDLLRRARSLVHGCSPYSNWLAGFGPAS